MKISSARPEPFSDIRRRSLAEAGARAAAPPAAADETRFLGLTEVELTPAVRAAIAALVIEMDELKSEIGRLRARLMEAEAAADQDPLTLVKNRRAFLREMRRVAAFAQRHGAPASLVYFDLDDLKGVNDRFGHAAGDAALRAVADRLSANVRESDVVGRMGGDEFAVLLIQADLPAAEAKAEALARAVETEPVSCGDWMSPVHVSWGVRQVDTARDPEALVADADQAMFVMKRSRRPG
jgi:diguanylate cyclase (GGDEF)-like protein